MRTKMRVTLLCSVLCGLALLLSCRVSTAAAQEEGIFRLPAGIKEIDEQAFANTSAVSIVLPEGVEYIGPYAFADCKVQAINLPASVASIDETAFSGTDPIITVVRGSFGEVWAHNHGFLCNYDSSQLEGFTYESFHRALLSEETGLMITSAPQGVEVLYLPDYIDNEPVLAVGNSLQEKNTALYRVHLPEKTVLLGSRAFSECTALADMDIPEGLRSVASYCFYNCTSLYGDLLLPDSLVYIENNAFNGCTGYTGQLRISDDIMLLGDYCFANCGFSGHVEYSRPGQNHGKYLFAQCRNITSATVNATTVTEGTFQDCSSLVSVTLNNPEISIIGPYAFDHCLSLQNIEWPAALKYIEKMAFAYCEGLTGELHIPDTVVSIGEESFYMCQNISKVACNGRLGKGAFSFCKGLREIEFGSKVSRISEYAFAHCYSLSGMIYLPDTVSTVDENVFWADSCTVSWKGSIIYNNGGSLADTVISIAKGEVGYREKISNSQLDDPAANTGHGDYTKYAAYFDNLRNQGVNYFNGNKNGYSWCAVFVNWCFAQAYGTERAQAMLYQPGRNSGAAGCTTTRQYYVNAGRFGSEPRVGAQIIFYDSADTSGSPYYHTGLVYAVDDNYVYTIEGNLDDMVKYAKYSRSTTKINSTCYIAGYGYPNYD